jgi:hypothetical protein
MDGIPASVLGTLQRLAAQGFELLPMPELETHYVVTRDGIVAMVERREDGSFGSSGNPGKLTDRGLALFVRRGDRFLFVAKGLEEEATPEEAASAQGFASELRRALEA